LIGCDAGFVWLPSWKLKVSEDGAAVSVTPVTLRVTGIVAGLPEAPVDVTTTEPVYEPAARPVVLTEMLIGEGTVPLAVAESHDPPVVVVALVVKPIPLVPAIFTDCETGWVPPIV